MASEVFERWVLKMYEQNRRIVLIVDNYFSYHILLKSIKKCGISSTNIKISTRGLRNNKNFEIEDSKEYIIQRDPQNRIILQS